MRYLIGILILANLAFFFWYPTADSESVMRNHLPPLPPDIKPLVLLSERKLPDTEKQPVDIGNGDPQSTNLGADTASSLPPINKRICLTVGPFFDSRSVNTVSTLLGKHKYNPKIRIGNLEEPSGYWVYLPAVFADRARDITADLDEQGMQDYYIGKNYVISLGIFSDQDKAAKRQKQVADMGYDAKLDRRYRTRQVYWLDIEETGQPLQVNPVWLQLLEDNPKIAGQTVSCE